MNAEAQPSVMRRKAGVGRPPPEIGQITTAVAIRTAVAHAAEDVAELVASAGNVEETRTTLEPFTEALPDSSLLCLVEGPAGRFGLVVLDIQTIAALIEIQTTGRVIPRPADPRPPTRTDAIMSADFIDRMLELIEEAVNEAELPVAPALTGYRYAMALAERRAIEMTLENIPYRLLRFSMDCSQGAKTGEIQILLPFDPPGARPDTEAEKEAFTHTLQEQVMDAEVVLGATLLRKEMLLADVAELKVGALITVPFEALAGVAVEGIDGLVVGHGRLGQVGGKRAVRLTLGAAMHEALAGGPAMAGMKDMPGAGMAMIGGPAAGMGNGGFDLGDLPGMSDPAPAAAPGGAAALDGLGALGDLGGAGDLGDLGDLGAMGSPMAGAESGLEGLGDLGSLGDLGDFDLPADLPDLPGLPDDLPDLASL